MHSIPFYVKVQRMGKLSGTGELEAWISKDGWVQRKWGKKLSSSSFLRETSPYCQEITFSPIFNPFPSFLGFIIPTLPIFVGGNPLSRQPATVHVAVIIVINPRCPKMSSRRVWFKIGHMVDVSLDTLTLFGGDYSKIRRTVSSTPWQTCWQH